MEKNESTFSGEHQDTNTSGWLTTFNDLVTLLMVFFVLVFSTSSIDNTVLKEFSGALQSGFGVLRQGRQAPVQVVDLEQPIEQQDSSPRPATTDNLHPSSGHTEEVAHRIQALNDMEGIQVTSSDQGIHITLEGNILFDFGKADLYPQSAALLTRIADAIRDMNLSVRIEGHTDNVPIQTRRYPSNWELSTARAVQVLRHFVERESLAPDRFSAVGYGDARPRYANDTAEQRSRNRRVEVILVTKNGGNDVD